MSQDCKDAVKLSLISGLLMNNVMEVYRRHIGGRKIIVYQYTSSRTENIPRKGCFKGRVYMPRPTFSCIINDTGSAKFTMWLYELFIRWISHQTAEGIKFVGARHGIYHETGELKDYYEFCLTIFWMPIATRQLWNS